MSTRPTVIVQKVLNPRGEISHCRIQIGSATLPAPFSESFEALEARVKKVTGIELTVAEVMAVTAAAREQMEREALRLKEVLLTKKRNMPRTFSAGIDSAERKAAL